MMPWIQVYSNLPEHPKLYRLSEGLGMQERYGPLGIVVSLWLWAARNAPEGDLSNYPRWAVARAAGWRRDPEDLCNALIASGFLDQDEAGGLHIHDWDEHAVMLMELNERSRCRTRERVRRYRQRHAQENAQETSECAETSPEQPPEPAPSPLPALAAADPVWGQLLKEFQMLPRWSQAQTGQLWALYQALGEAKCHRALELGRNHHGESWPYIRGILENWQEKNQAAAHTPLSEAQVQARKQALMNRLRKEDHHGLETGSPTEA